MGEEWAGARMSKVRYEHEILFLEPEKKIGKSRGRLEHSIKSNLKDMKCEDVDTIQLAWIGVRLSFFNGDGAFDYN
jgi:hypothetical protein